MIKVRTLRLIQYYYLISDFIQILPSPINVLQSKRQFFPLFCDPIQDHVWVWLPCPWVLPQSSSFMTLTLFLRTLVYFIKYFLIWICLMLPHDSIDSGYAFLVRILQKWCVSMIFRFLFYSMCHNVWLSPGWLHDLWGPVQNQNAGPQVWMGNLVSSCVHHSNHSKSQGIAASMLGHSWFLVGSEREPLMHGTGNILWHQLLAHLPECYGVRAQPLLLLHLCPSGRRWWNVGFPQPGWPSSCPGARLWMQCWAKPKGPGVRSRQS